MKCEQVERLLAEDIKTGAREARRHLEECVGCRKLYRELNELAELSRGLSEDRGAPWGFSCYVFRRAQRSSRLAGLAAPAVVMLLALAALGISSRWTETAAGPAVAAATPLEPAEEMLQRPSSPPIHERHHSEHVDVIFQADRPGKPPEVMHFPSVIHIRRTQPAGGPYHILASY